MATMKFILGAVIWLLLSLLFILPIAISSIIKLIITTIYCRFRNNQGNYRLLKLSSIDPLVSPNYSWKVPINHVGFVLKIEGVIPVTQFREHFAHCFNIPSEYSKETNQNEDNDCYDKLLSYIVLRGGYAFRAQRKTVNLSEHILERHLHNEGDEISDDGGVSIKTVEEFLTWWNTQGYLEHRPCWEIAVIPIPSKNTTAIAFKMNHGLCDAYSLLHIIDKLTNAKSPYLVKDFEDGYWSQFKQMLEYPKSQVRGKLKAKNPFLLDTPPQDHKNEAVFSFTSFPLEDIKLLRKKHGNVHVASIIWTILTGAIRQYLVEVEGVEDIPQFVKMGNTFPWPRHPGMTSGTKNADKICNHWVSGLLTFPLREPDPLVRLHKIEAEIASFVSHDRGLVFKRIVEPALSSLPSVVAKVMLRRSADLGMCGLLTSLIGSDSPYSLCGCPVQNIHPFMSLQDDLRIQQPFSCFTFSHAGRVELTIQANTLGLLKDKQSLDILCHKYCQEALQSILIASNTKDSVHVQILKDNQ